MQRVHRSLRRVRSTMLPEDYLKIFKSDHTTLNELFADIDSVYSGEAEVSNILSEICIQPETLNQLEVLEHQDDIKIFIRSNFQEYKVLITDELERCHEFLINCHQSKYLITETYLPSSEIDKLTFSSLTEAVDAYRKHLDELSDYIHELKRIDQLCWVVDPINKNFKDNYRRIVIDENTWLHIEVNCDGSLGLTNVVGASKTADAMREKLNKGLRHWDEGRDIIDNIMHILDIDEFPAKPTELSIDKAAVETVIECGICLCSELPGLKMPEPICGNTKCGVYFHSSCLYEWLMSSNGGLAPRFGVATGACPNCLQPVACAAGAFSDAPY